MIVTTSLTTGIGKVADGTAAAYQLIDQILELEHARWETTLSVGETAFYSSKKDGPFPTHQFRISVSPRMGVAACHYLDNDDSDMPSAISWSSSPRDAKLVFNGATGAVFPPTAVIDIADSRSALREWVHSRQRPTCIQWRPYDMY